MNNTLAIILAGGRGERMRQLCQTRGKPALSVAGDLRVIDFCLSNCLHSGIKQIAIVTGYQEPQLANYVRSWAVSNNGHSIIHVIYPRNNYAGTADAVWQNIALVKKNSLERIIILPADHVYKMNYSKLLQFHNALNADLTVAVTPVPIEHAHRYGIVTTYADGRILEFREKPPAPATNLASMGIYVFNRQTLLECLANDASELYSPHDFGYSIIPQIVGTKRVFAYKFNGYWRDIGTIESYYQTNLELIDELPHLNAGRKWTVLTQASVLPFGKVSGQGKIVHSLISPGCIVNGTVRNSVLSSGVIINEHAVVTNSIIMSKASIGEYSHLNSCIIDEDVDIGRSCYIGLRGKSNDAKFDITIIGPGVSVTAYNAVYRGSRVLRSADLPSSSMQGVYRHECLASSYVSAA